MKWLVVVLMITNLAYFGWEYNQQLISKRNTLMVEAETIVKELPAGTPVLQLLREAQQAPEQTTMVSETSSPQLESDISIAEQEHQQDEQPIAVSNAEPIQETSAQLSCYSIGPIQKEEDSKTTFEWLQEHAQEANQRIEEIQENKRFWVYLEPADDPDLTQQTLEELGRRGVKDYRLIKKGDMKNAISLGVYAAQDSVNRRLAEMKKQGYTPVVVPRYKTRSTYWLDFSTQAPDILAEIPNKKAPTHISCERFEKTATAQ